MINFIQSDSHTIKNVFNIQGDYDYEITPYLIKNVEWGKIFSLLLSFREEYNDYSGRFLKADLMGYAFEKFSNGKIKYIDEDGCDFYLPKKQIRLELKSGLQLFQTSRSYNTVEIKLKNFNGNETGFCKTFDYLMLVEPQMVGVISYEKIMPYTYKKDDGIYCKIELKDVELFKQTNIVKVTEKNLTDIRKKMIESCLNEIDELYNYESV